LIQMTARWEELFARLPRGRRVAVISIGAVFTALVLALAWWIQRPLSRPLPVGGGDPPERLAPSVEAARVHVPLPERVSGPSTALEYQASIERGLADRIDGLLGAVVGRDKTIARVAATVDFARVERTEESYDPDRAVLRRQRTRREWTAAGVDGKPAREANESGVPRTERRDDSESYVVSKVVSRTFAPVGALKRISVAVLIDGTYTERDGKPVFTPRPQEELDRLKELVKNAVGFSEARGDRIQIASVPFQRDVTPAAARVLSTVAHWGPVFLVRLVAVGFAVAMLFYVVRPVVIALATRPRAESRAAPPAAAATERLTRETLALVRRDPERAAQLVREWLSESVPGLEPGR
jgi:flagellar M-ring protein FliF